MNDIRKYINIIENIGRKKTINEGVKFTRKEMLATMKNSKDYQMGIEYEFLTPNPDDRIQEAKEFVEKYKISRVEKIEKEHSKMMEVVTQRMPISEGLRHIRNFFAAAEDFGITFPSTAGLHISISHRDAHNKEFNYTKFLVLLSGDYLHSIFPEREYVESVERELHDLILEHRPKSVSEVEYLVNTYIDSGEKSVGGKYITAKLSDYDTLDGRVELRYAGGKNYNLAYDAIKILLFRNIYILSIALDKNTYRKEYLKQIGKIIASLPELSPEEALYELKYHDLSPVKISKMEKIVSMSAEFSYKYAKDVLEGRFEKGEDAIATDAEYSYYYARDVIKGRFEKGEEAIEDDDEYSEYYQRLLPELSLSELNENYIAGVTDPSELIKTANNVIENLADYDEIESYFNILDADEVGNLMVDISSIIESVSDYIAYFNGDDFLDVQAGNISSYEDMLDEVPKETQDRVFQYLHDNYKEEIMDQLDIDEDNFDTAEIRANFDEIMQLKLDDELKMAFFMADQDAAQNGIERELAIYIVGYINDHLYELNLNKIDNLFEIIDVSDTPTSTIIDNDVVAFIESLKAFNGLQDIDDINLDGYDYDALGDLLNERLIEALPPTDDE